ncbi:MAG: hypothetical protein U0903_06270 [Planctomycetales bacterium]
MRTQQLLMCTLLLLSAVPCLAQENISSQERQKRREAIIAMPPRQRDILTKNFNEFRSLTPEQRDAYRQLLGEINQHHDRDKLTQALKNYHDWLKDLGEKHYLELQEIKDPEKKLQRIKEITDLIEQQRKDKEKTLEDLNKIAQLQLANSARKAEAAKSPAGDPANAPKPLPPFPATTPQGRLMGQLQDRYQQSPQVFAEILKAVETRMREIKAITPDEDAKLINLKGWERSHMLILEILPNKQDRTEEDLLNADLRESIARLLSPEAFEFNSSKSFLENKRHTVQVIVYGMLSQLQELFYDPATTDSQKRTIREMIEERMNGEEKNRIASMINPQNVSAAIAAAYTRQIFEAFIRAGEIYPPNGSLKARLLPRRPRDNPDRLSPEKPGKPATPVAAPMGF